MENEKCLLNPERDCLGLIKAREVESKLKDVESDLADLRKQNSSTHERLFDRLNMVEKEEGIQRVQYENIMEKLTDLLNDMEELKMEPGKKWNDITKQIIGIVVAAVVGYFLARMGLS